MFNLLSVYIYLPVIYIHICTCGRRRRKYINDFELKGNTYFKFFFRIIRICLYLKFNLSFKNVTQTVSSSEKELSPNSINFSLKIPPIV